MRPTSRNRAASESSGSASQNTGARAGFNEVPGLDPIPGLVGRAAPAIDTPKLLVSVRSQSEVLDGLAAGVDFLDLKEPRQGALAPAGVDLWRYAASAWRKRSPSESAALPCLSAALPCLSAALGERSEAVRIAARLPEEFAFAKAGPSGCRRLRHVRDLWDDVRQRLEDRARLVAVAYADSRRARCAEPEQIFQEAIAAGLRHCLIDTYSKDGRSTVDHLGVDRLRRISDLAREAGLWWVLAGSVSARVVAPLWSSGVQPSCFGVRGDVCDRGRSGKLSIDRVHCWKQTLASLQSVGITSA